MVKTNIKNADKLVWTLGNEKRYFNIVRKITNTSKWSFDGKKPGPLDTGDLIWLKSTTQYFEINIVPEGTFIKFNEAKAVICHGGYPVMYMFLVEDKDEGHCIVFFDGKKFGLSTLFDKEYY